MAIVQLAIMILMLITGLLFINSLSKTAHIISFRNRKLDPVSVWYLLIPVYNYYYYFVVVKRLSKSIHAEYNTRNIPIDDKPAYLTGILSAAFFAFNVVLYAIQKLGLYDLMIFGGIRLIGVMIWIAYWIQISQYKKQLKDLAPIAEDVTI